jgi:hypothetical protein
MSVINIDHLSKRREDASRKVKEASDAAEFARAMSELMTVESILQRAD